MKKWLCRKLLLWYYVQLCSSIAFVTMILDYFFGFDLTLVLLYLFRFMLLTFLPLYIYRKIVCRS